MEKLISCPALPQSRLPWATRLPGAMRWITAALPAIVMMLLACDVVRAADGQVFSGPQAGEKLAPLIITGVFDEEAGKEIDLVSEADGKPLVLIFFHQRTRPAFGLINTVMQFAASRAKDGLVGGVIFLTDDPTSTENWMKRVQRYFPQGVTMGISADGLEGPGSYGLNRNVALTVLVGKDNKVTENFALVQPSVQADGPKIFQAIVAALGGGEVPDITQFSGQRYAADMPALMTRDANLRALLRPVIRKDATPAEVEKAAVAVEEYAAKNKAAREQIGRISGRIIGSGRLKNYGTPAAQEYLRKWAKKYGAAENKKPEQE